MDGSRPHDGPGQAVSGPPSTVILGRLHARVRRGSDTKAPLLLAHGLTDDGGCWPDALPHWRDRTVYAVDLTGHGRSPRFAPDELADPVPVIAADVAAALHAVAEREGRPALGIGHSMGAGALALAALDGAPVAGLVLEDPRIAHETTRVRERLGRMRAREQDLWATDPAGARADLERACPRWSRAELDAAAAARPYLDRAFLATGRSGLHGDDALQLDVMARTAATVPTTLVTGDVSVVWGPELVEQLRATGAPLTIAVLPGADHCARRTAPEAYYETVAAALPGA